MSLRKLKIKVAIPLLSPLASRDNKVEIFAARGKISRFWSPLVPMGANALYDTLGCPAEGKVEQPLSRPMAGRDHPLDKTETLSGACSLNCVIDVKGSFELPSISHEGS